MSEKILAEMKEILTKKYRRNDFVDIYRNNTSLTIVGFKHFAIKPIIMATLENLRKFEAPQGWEKVVDMNINN